MLSFFEIHSIVCQIPWCLDGLGFCNLLKNLHTYLSYILLYWLYFLHYNDYIIIIIITYR